MTHLNFIAVDFETANSQRASVCQVGLVRVEKGQVVAQDSWLVVPPTGVDSFNYFNVQIHGIRPEHVEADGISWRESVPRFTEFARGLPMVAHNAPFDRSVFERSTEFVGLTPTRYRWEDSVRLARRHLPHLPNHKLPTVAQELGLNTFTHHEALADSLACAGIVCTVAERAGLASFDSLWER